MINPSNRKKELISRIFEMHAKDRTPIEEAEAGQIAAVIGPKHSTTGDTLCDPDHPILLERITFPEPVITMSGHVGQALAMNARTSSANCRAPA